MIDGLNRFLPVGIKPSHKLLNFPCREQGELEWWWEWKIAHSHWQQFSLVSPFSKSTSEESKESESFKTLLHARIQEFVEEVLSPYFGGMVAFVKDTEMLLEKGLTRENCCQWEWAIFHSHHHSNSPCSLQGKFNSLCEGLIPTGRNLFSPSIMRSCSLSRTSRTGQLFYR